MTVPSTSIASFLATGGDRLLVRSLLGLPRHGGPRPARRGTVMRAPRGGGARTGRGIGGGHGGERPRCRGRGRGGRWAGARTASVSGGDHDGQALARGVVGGEDPRPFGGDGDGMLEVGGEAAVRGAHGPAVVVPAPLRAAEHEHRLDGQAEARLELPPARGETVVRDLGILVHLGADAVSHEGPPAAQAVRDGHALAGGGPAPAAGGAGAPGPPLPPGGGGGGWGVAGPRPPPPGSRSSTSATRRP